MLFASILRKLGFRAFLVTVPGHMFMGVYLTADADQRVGLETTMIGGKRSRKQRRSRNLKDLRRSVRRSTRRWPRAWRGRHLSLRLAVGTQNLEENQKEFEANDQPQYQITDINQARKDGIMPISYQKAE